MTKADLVSHVASETGLTRAQATAAVESFTNGIKGALGDGKKVTLVGFGTFQVRHRAARTGRNPQTREPIQIPASNTVGFKPGQALRDAVNG